MVSGVSNAGRGRCVQDAGIYFPVACLPSLLPLPLCHSTRPPSLLLLSTAHPPPSARDTCVINSTRTPPDRICVARTLVCFSCCACFSHTRYAFKPLYNYLDIYFSVCVCVLGIDIRWYMTAGMRLRCAAGPQAKKY